jgi:hypothetical protein
MIGAWIDTGFCSSLRVGNIFIEVFGPNSLDPHHWRCICKDLDICIGIEAPDLDKARERALANVTDMVAKRRDGLNDLVESLRKALDHTEDDS